MKRAPVLSRRLVLETPVRTPDGAGGQGRVWSALGTLWAEVVPRSGVEGSFGVHEVGRVRVRITVRAAPHGAPSRPKPDQRFREAARIYTIQAVTEADPDGRFLVCYAEEGFAS